MAATDKMMPESDLARYVWFEFTVNCSNPIVSLEPSDGNQLNSAGRCCKDDLPLGHWSRAVLRHFFKR